MTDTTSYLRSARYWLDQTLDQNENLILRGEGEIERRTVLDAVYALSLAVDDILVLLEKRDADD